ncbi:MAG: hypothetical protein GY862_23330 [Gammaproteobacteria bacterium]|nr:hypothetical protein [Gammaproteobacteria bacterium]
MNALKKTKYTIKNSWIMEILLFVIFGIGMASIIFMIQINNELKEIAEKDMPVMEAITQITLHKQQQTHWFERALRHAEIAVYVQEKGVGNKSA